MVIYLFYGSGHLLARNFLINVHFILNWVILFDTSVEYFDRMGVFRVTDSTIETLPPDTQGPEAMPWRIVNNDLR
jgi:hypothetical protein